MKKRRFPEIRFIMDMLKSPESSHPLREKKKPKRIGVRITEKHYKELEILSKHLKKSKSELVRKAIVKLLWKKALEIYMENRRRYGKN